MPSPYWSWCPAPGAARSSALSVDINNYGDGYVHRSTRGLNPVRPSWTLSFPFRKLAELDAMDAHLRAYALGGFYFRPPDSATDVFVTCDQWSASITDRTGGGDKVGQLQAQFDQAFNPQPLNPAVVAKGPASVPVPLSPAPPGPVVAAVAVAPRVPSPLDQGGEMLPSPTVVPPWPLTPTGATR